MEGSAGTATAGGGAGTGVLCLLDGGVRSVVYGRYRLLKEGMRQRKNTNADRIIMPVGLQ